MCFLSKFENLLIVEDKEIRKNKEVFHFIHLHSHILIISLLVYITLLIYIAASFKFSIPCFFVKMHCNLH